MDNIRNQKEGVKGREDSVANKTYGRELFLWPEKKKEGGREEDCFLLKPIISNFNNYSNIFDTFYHCI